MKKTKKIKENRNSFRFLLPYFKRQKGQVALLCCMAVLYAIFEILSPWLVGRAIDSMTAGGVDFPLVFQIVGLLAGLYLLSSAFYYIVLFCSNRCALKIIEAIRADVFAKLQKIEIKSIDANSTGDYISRFVNDAQAVSDGIVQAGMNIFGGTVTVIGTLIMMFVISPAVAATVVVITSIVYVVAGLITKYTNQYFRSQQSVLGEMGGFVDETTASVRTLKAFRYEEQAVNRFEEINGRLYTEGKKAVFYGSLYNPSTRFVNYLAYISVGVIGVAVAGLSAGRVSSFIIYSNQFAKPFQQITAVLSQIMTALAAAGRLSAVLHEPDEPAVETGTLPARIRGEVEFRDVCFRYSPDRPLIEHFSFRALPGQTVAIVGPTGAGKTTVVNLLMRFYDSYTGQILIDGVDIKSVTKASLRDHISMVLQETAVFHESVAQNISYGRKASGEQIRAAAASAQAAGFIRCLPKEYDTVLGDDFSLSEGQKQLLTIARAMLEPKEIVLLDEATSRVDVLTEQKITAAMEQLSKGSTSFIIAHRLSTIQNADQIIVMRDGSVVETGTHKQLLENGGFYSELWNSSLTQKDADDEKE